MDRRGRRRVASVALVASFTVGAIGCSLGFHPSDYEDDTDETDGASMRDAGAALDVTVTDAGGDVTVAADAPTTSGDDGETAADGSTLRYCQRIIDAAFCSDWDEAGSVEQDWSANDIGGGGTLVVDTAFDAASPPGSARAMFVPLRQDAALGAGAYVQKNLATTPREVRLDFDFNVGQLSGDHLTFVSLYFVGHETRGMYLALDDNSTTNIGLVTVSNLADASNWHFDSFPYPVDSGPPWNHLTVDIVVASDGTGRMTAYLNGAVVGQPLTKFPFDPDTAANTLQLTVGLQRTPNTVTPTMDVRFDNVVLSYPP